MSKIIGDELDPHLMRLVRRHAAQQGVTAKELIEATLAESLDPIDDRLSAEDLAESAISGQLDSHLMSLSAADLNIEEILPDEVDDAKVVNAELRPASLEWHQQDAYDGETIVGEAIVTVDLSLEGTARIDREVKVRFNIILNEGSGSVDTVDMIGAESTS